MSVGSWTTDELTALAWGIPLSACTVALIAPWGRRFAWVIGAVDRPNTRKIHHGSTPRLGGLSAAVAVIICVALWCVVDPTATAQCRRYWGLLPGAAIMLGVGLFDDLFRLGPRVKLGFQFLAAAIICVGGVRVETLHLPLVGSISLGWLGPVVTLVWIVGVTNALNFLDGLDGLAAGTAALASSSFLLIAGFSGLTSMLGLLSAALIGACVVLVVNNVRSPKSFLGDSGSLLLGVLVASTGILASQSNSTGGTRLALPAVVLAVPLVDMTACVVRRLLVGRSVFAADRGHIHHMLLSFGFSPNRAAGVLCGATAVLGIAAAAAAHAPAWVEGAVVLAVAGLSAVVYRWFGYLSLRLWLHCRRANRILATLLARTQRGPHAKAASVEAPEAERDLLPARLGLVVERIRRARRALGIDYIRVQRETPEGGRDASAGAILELGRKPDAVVTTHLYAEGRCESERLTVVLGEGRGRRPARIHAKELLMMPLLTELAAAVEQARGERAASPARREASLEAALTGN